MPESNDHYIIEADATRTGYGDIVFNVGGTEYARIRNGGAGTGLLGGSRPVIRGSRIWGLGDSLTTGRGTGTQGPDGQPFFGTKQHIAWAALISNGRIYVENWAATTGFTTAQILATHLPTVVAAKPAGCLVLGGTNDLPGATAAIPASTLSNLTAIYQGLVTAGITPILCTIPPRNGYTKPVQQLNAWIKRQAYVNGYPLVDIYSVLADQATSNYITGLDDGDGLHMSPAGAQIAGQALSDALTTWMQPFSPWIAASNLDISCAPSPLFMVDTNADGVPDNFALDGFSAGVGSLASDAAVLGNAWTITRAGADLTARPATALTAAAGDRVSLALRINTSGLTASATGQLYVGIQTGDGTNVDRAITAWTRDLGGWRTVYLEGVIPAGKTNATAWVLIKTANFTVKLAQLTLINLTANGLAT